MGSTRMVRMSGTWLAILLLVAWLPLQSALAAAIEVIGTDKFKSQISGALTLLKSKSPDAYKVVADNIGVIKQSEHSGMRADATPPVFEINDASAFYSPTWCASVIAHDSFHSKLYHDYLKAHPGEVPSEAWTGHEAEKKCLEHQVKVLKSIGAPENEITYCSKISPDYADVPYEKRNW
ncbi:MAG: hypothetical protein K8R92_02500 [Planctomycetes bacterium]|nr:hypothetical protein [Planctomycetota bacterium]